MVRKKTLYSTVMGAWFLLSIAAGIGTIFGVFEPVVSVEDVPYGPLGAFGFMFASIITGMFVIGRLRKRAWKAAGRDAGLEPENGGLIGTPDLEGTIRGRGVRLHKYTVSKGGGGEGGSNSQTYTLVEADLAQPVERGFFLGSDEGPENSAETDMPDELQTHRIAGEYYAFGDVSAEGASRLFTNEVRDAFRAGAGGVVVGDPTDAIMSAAPDDGGFFVNSIADLAESKIRDTEGFDQTTVAHTRKGLMMNPERMEAQIDAAAAVAEAYETTDTRPETDRRAADPTSPPSSEGRRER